MNLTELIPKEILLQANFTKVQLLECMKRAYDNGYNEGREEGYDVGLIDGKNEEDDDDE